MSLVRSAGISGRGLAAGDLEWHSMGLRSLRRLSFCQSVIEVENAGSICR